MNEAVRLEIVQRRQQGVSMRSIAAALGVSRGAVTRVLSQVEAQRAGSPPPPASRRPSILDPFEPLLKELLDRYPNLTVERALQELRGRGFTGRYTIVRQRMKRLRPRAAPTPVPRFETGPGEQAQMDFGVYDLDFSREGRRRVYLFSYLLGYSRRQYLRFVESMDLPTTLREHVHAFHHLGGVARACLYDNFKAVVVRHDADGPQYNPRFLAFATHYGFRPQACRVRRPQTKGKVERAFHYAEVNLLNGRTFESLDHLNEVTAHWLAEVADGRILRDFQESPRDRHERERPHLLPLPARDFDTALVVYRHVNVEGYLAHRSNFYSVPWSYIGQVLPVRIDGGELIVYSTGLDEIARHPLVAATRTGVRQSLKSHHPGGDPEERTRLLRQRFAELGPIGTAFLDGLLAKQVQGKLQAQHLLALAGQYARDDVRAALDRAVRFGAFSLAAVRRILAASAQPKPLLDELAELHRDTLDPALRDDVIGPRPTRDYQHLLAADEPVELRHETPPEEERPPTDSRETECDPEPA
jgi:transposase